MKPPKDLPNGKPPLPVGQAASPDARYAAVRSDLHSIFAPIVPSAAKTPLPRAALAGGKPVRSGVRVIGIVVALALVCFVVGLAWLRRPAATVPIAAPAASGNVAAPARNAAPTAGAVIATAGSTDNDVAPVAPVPAPTAPIPRAASTARVAVRNAAAGAPARPTKLGHHAGRAASPGVVDRRDGPINAAPAECTPADSAWCLRGNTVAADRELRDAYEAAIRAKVKRRTLVHIHHEWVKYRRLANKKPRELIRGYDTLTVDLHQAASQTDGTSGVKHGR